VIRVSVHPAARAGLKLVVGTLAAVIALAFAARSLGVRQVEPPVTKVPAATNGMAQSGMEFIPTIELCVDNSAMESAWISALATHLGGRSEVSIPGGRVDVVTDTFAIEVERSAKWHEGIGQSLHYAEATGLRPALAVIVVASSEGTSIRQLDEADAIATKQGIKVVTLTSACKDR